jgi:hypothetical protein
MQLILSSKSKSRLNQDLPDLILEMTTESHEEMDELYEIYIGQPHKTRHACVYISVDDSSIAQLEAVNFRDDCTIGTVPMQQGSSRTVRMIQGALQYIIHTYPHVKTISLNDKSEIPSGKIHVTPKRLLQGRKGWYEEYLGARPDKWHRPTINLIEELQTPSAQQRIQTFLPITTQHSWGKTHEILEMAKQIVPIRGQQAIIGTSWVISRKTIQTYPMNFTVQKDRINSGESGGGGAGIRETIKKHAQAYKGALYRQWKKWKKK